MEAINWMDNGSTNNAQSFVYDVPYFSSDFFLAFMFLRFYFFMQAAIMFSPVNDRLHGKRVCQNAGFEPVFTFQVRAAMQKSPVSTFVIMACVLIFSLSYTTRIFERPYFAFCFAS